MLVVIREKLALADYYLGQNRLADAKRVLDPLVEAEGGAASSGAELRLAQIMYSKKRTADANAALDRVART